MAPPSGRRNGCVILYAPHPPAASPQAPFPRTRGEGSRRRGRVRATCRAMSSSLATRWRFADLIDRKDLMRDRVAQQVEPAATTVAVHPSLGEHALRVGAHIKVIAPRGIAVGIGISGTGNVRFAAA